MSRRDFGRLAGGFGAALLAARAPAFARGAAKVVVVGGGAGGATTARLIKRAAPQLDVTLIESNPIYTFSSLSNLYLGGLRPLESLNHAYAGLHRSNVTVVQDTARDVDAAARVVRTAGGRTYRYDRLVLGPGVNIKYQSIQGYSRAAAEVMPHAYTSEAHGKRMLKRHLRAMRDGGTVLLAPPKGPYGCPPAPYERACMIAHYLKTRKPRSKLIILDAKKSIPEQAAFAAVFDRYYRNVVELHLSRDVEDLALLRVNPRTREIFTRSGRRLRPDVANIIPPQRAGVIAGRAGCTVGDWCPVTERFRSKTVKHVYVIGDACQAPELAKSAYAAHSQAGIVAEDIVADLAGKPRGEVHYESICWSVVAPGRALRIGTTFAAYDGRMKATQGSMSDPTESDEARRQNYAEALAWYARMSADMFGTPKSEPAHKAG
ncbi:MAG TPA: NAD(P)/FAD-dependent oxidoreductase [Hyphomicrobiaceae bacterium]|nr:NAD(P)/FAD-dependent oxidoreductase [Hyphomicrobiaceae bacterium]